MTPTIDQRRRAEPLGPCPVCGGRLSMGRFRRNGGRNVEILAVCDCGYSIVVIRSIPGRNRFVRIS